VPGSPTNPEWCRVAANTGDDTIIVVNTNAVMIFFIVKSPTCNVASHAGNKSP
jgi:hypothetical protein